jgi:DNA-directed RNA polymerase specialized sigma subunit
METIMKKEKRKTEHYLDNKKFFEEMQKWKKTILEAEQSGEDKPPVTEYIGLAFLQIAENLAKKPNFVNYQFKEDMISDGVENCLMYASNFDPEKSNNPFSYFTQIIYYAFLRRIQKEKKQNYIKYKYLESLDKVGDFSEILRMMGITDEEKNSFSAFEKKSKGKKKE